MTRLSDEELKEILAVGDGKETVILTISGGSLYEEYEEIRPAELPYNDVLKCHVHHLGDIEWYLHERFLGQEEPGKSIFEDHNTMQRAIQLIEEAWNE